MRGRTHSDERRIEVESTLTGQFCTSCDAFQPHSAPVNTSPSTTGQSGCPECMTASLRPVVAERGDDRTVDGGYIPAGQRDAVITVAEACSRTGTTAQEVA